MPYKHWGRQKGRRILSEALGSVSRKRAPKQGPQPAKIVRFPHKPSPLPTIRDLFDGYRLEPGPDYPECRPVHNRMVVGVPAACGCRILEAT